MPVTLISLLRRTTQHMVDEITDRLEAAGHPDSPPRFHPVFESLDPDGTRLTVLSARTGHTHQAIGQVVDELEQRGYVERVPDPDDRRARLIRLTDPGRALVRAALDVIDDIEREWTDHLRAAGLRGDLRSALAAALGAAGPGADPAGRQEGRAHPPNTPSRRPTSAATASRPGPR